MKIGIDILGNIVLLKFDYSEKQKDKKKYALEILNKHNHVRTVLEKTGKFSGRLRKQKTKWLAGEKTKEALYRENGCVFRFNVDTCYFSPRLSEERKEIAGKVKKGEKVLVMFGGVGPFACVIGKRMSQFSKLSSPSARGLVVSVELGRECNKYAKTNVKRNKLSNVEIVGGDVRKVFKPFLNAVKSKNMSTLIYQERLFSVSKKYKKELIKKFDRIVMARPNLKDSFLDVAFPLCKKNGIIHYYGFYSEGEIGKMKELIVEEAKKAKRKIKILGIKKAGDIGVRKFRYRVDIEIIS
jgi:tRNA (guanine37-N1)-methyltransferase